MKMLYSHAKNSSQQFNLWLQIGIVRWDQQTLLFFLSWLKDHCLSYDEANWELYWKYYLHQNSEKRQFSLSQTFTFDSLFITGIMIEIILNFQSWLLVLYFHPSLSVVLRMFFLEMFKDNYSILDSSIGEHLP